MLTLSISLEHWHFSAFLVHTLKEQQLRTSYRDLALSEGNYIMICHYLRLGIVVMLQSLSAQYSFMALAVSRLKRCCSLSPNYKWEEGICLNRSIRGATGCHHIMASCCQSKYSQGSGNIDLTFAHHLFLDTIVQKVDSVVPGMLPNEVGFPYWKMENQGQGQIQCKLRVGDSTV